MAERRNADFTTGASCPTPSSETAKPSQAEGELRGSEPNVDRASESPLSGGNVGEVGSARTSAESIGASRMSGATAMGSYASSDASVSRQAAEAGREAKEAAQEVAGAAKRQAMETAAHARDAFASQASKLQEQGVQFAARQKDFVADEVCHVGAALREAGRKLHDEGDDRLASYADQAAEGIDGVGRYLRESDSAQLVGDFEQFARRRPEIVYGGLFLAGLGIARFLKASRSRRRSDERYAVERAPWDEDADDLPESYATRGTYDPYAATASYMASAVTARYPEDEGDNCDVV